MKPQEVSVSTNELLEKFHGQSLKKKHQPRNRREERSRKHGSVHCGPTVGERNTVNSIVNSSADVERISRGPEMEAIRTQVCMPANTSLTPVVRLPNHDACTLSPHDDCLYGTDRERQSWKN